MCPTCSATMQGTGYGVFHCKRCGTMKNADESFTVPAVVVRCRELMASMIDDTGHGQLMKKKFHTYGVTESVLPPGERPT